MPPPHPPRSLRPSRACLPPDCYVITRRARTHRRSEKTGLVPRDVFSDAPASAFSLAAPCGAVNDYDNDNNNDNNNGWLHGGVATRSAALTTTTPATTTTWATAPCDLKTYKEARNNASGKTTAAALAGPASRQGRPKGSAQTPVCFADSLGTTSETRSPSAIAPFGRTGPQRGPRPATVGRTAANDADRPPDERQSDRTTPSPTRQRRSHGNGDGDGDGGIRPKRERRERGARARSLPSESGVSTRRLRPLAALPRA